MNKYGFEDILTEVGNYNVFQKKLLWIFLVPGCFTLPIFIMNYLFLLGVPDHWCHVQGRDKFNMSMEDWKAVTIPRMQEEGVETVRYDKCKVYQMKELLQTPGMTAEKLKEIDHIGIPVMDCPPEYGWSYDQTYYLATVASHFNWVCGDASYVPYAFLLNSLGNVIGPFIFSPLGDYYGRKMVFFGLALMQFVFSMAMTYPPNQRAFLSMLFIKSMTFPACFQVAYIEVLEFMGPEKRGLVNMMLNVAWSIGLCMMTLVAWLCDGYWRTFNLVLTCTGLYLFLYWKFLKESPRWLISKGKLKEAEAVLTVMAKQNKTYPIQDLKEKIEDSQEEKVQTLKETFIIFTYKKQILRMVLLTVGWVAVLILYYGVHLNLSNISGNPYINQFLMAAIEAPGYISAWFLMERIGRRWCEALLLLVAGVSYIIIPAIPLHLNWLIVLLTVIAKFGVSGAFMVVYMQAPEIFPTPVRSTAMAIPSVASNIVNLGTPYIIYLGTTYYAVPYVVLGGITLIAAPLVLFLPETLKQSLPQTVRDAEEFGKGHKYFSLNVPKQKIVRKWSSTRRPSDLPPEAEKPV